MSLVHVQVQPGREWVWSPVEIGATAVNVKCCRGQFQRLDRGGFMAEVGTVLVEYMRNSKGVAVSVVLPNGYPFPTGRSAPNQTWFPMLKAHLRSWLAMTSDGRIVRLVNEALPTLETRHTSGEIGTAEFNGAREKLLKYKADAMGALPPGADERDILAAFYNWVTEVSGQTGVTQKRVTEVVIESLRAGRVVPVPDLKLDFGPAEARRFLDL